MADQSRPAKPPNKAKAASAERLAAALRANLKRRKAAVAAAAQSKGKRPS